MDIRPQVHVVSTGESLSSIAKKYGFSDPMLIYSAGCNEALRRARPSPDMIRAGDKLSIPPSPEAMQQALRDRVVNLRRLRQETEQMFGEIIRELDQTIAEGRKRTNAIDYVGTVLLGLASITQAGFKAMTLSGAALETANQKLASGALKFAYKPVYDLALKRRLDDLGAHEGVQGTIGASLHVLANLTTPSYWAGVYTNVRAGNSFGKVVAGDPLQPVIDAKTKVQQQLQQTLGSIDRQIQDTQWQLLRCSATGGHFLLYDGSGAAIRNLA